MEKQIVERFDDLILKEAMSRFRIDQENLEILDGFESFIYKFRRDDGVFILRIGHDLRRNENLVLGEVDWINYLASGGVSVSRAIESRQGNLVESIADGHGGNFIATAFVQAPGSAPSEKDWNETLLHRYGRHIGQMHSLTREYRPAKPEWKRPNWDDPVMLDVVRWIPESEPLVLRRYLALENELDLLERNQLNYGLIHQDAHAGNFFVDRSGRITLFDFDDCVYGWYVNDIAIALFYALAGREDAIQFTPCFLRPFLQGYQETSPIDLAEIENIPKFLRLREIDLYAVIHRSFDIDNIESPWVARFMKDRKSRIAYDVPFVDYDFSKLSI